MAEKDLTTKNLESYNNVFADMVNGFLFKGKAIIKENELTPAETESNYKTSGKIRWQERDIAKYWQSATIKIAFIGFENQAKADKYVALRIMGYDGSMYRAQYKAKQSDDNQNEKAYPVITLVIYFGKEDWNYGTNLHSCLDIPPELLPFVSDYKVNFYSLKDMTEDEINHFQSDFKVIAEFFHALSSGEDYHPTNQKLDHPEEVLDMISTFSGDDRFRNEYNTITNEEKEGGVTMYSIYDKILQEGEAKGRAEGEAKGRAEGEAKGRAEGEAKGFLRALAELVKDGILTLSEAAKRANMSVEEFQIEAASQA